MNFQFTNPAWLLLLFVAVPWTLWLTLKSDVHIGAGRRWTACGLRLVIVLALVMAIAGLQWKHPQEGLNVFFLLDRSDSIPPEQQEAARLYVAKGSELKKPIDKAGVLVFGTDAAIDTSPNQKVGDQKIQAVVGGGRTDVASAIRLGTAAFPETGQKRLVLVSDGNENVGDAFAAVVAARPLGVTVDVVPLGVARGGDVSVQKLSLPANIKKGQTFEVKIFAQADEAQGATVRLFQNDHLLGEQKVQLESGKNLFTFPQTLTQPDFYSYEVQIEAPGDSVPQHNRAINFTTVRGDPRVLLVSAEPDKDVALAETLRSANLHVNVA